MIDIIDALPEHATWVESSLRKSQRDACFIAPTFPRHLLPGRTRVARLPGQPDEWLGWCASVDDILVYVYVRYAVRRQGIASELIADAAATSGVSSMRACTWTRAADHLHRRISYHHSAREWLDHRANKNNPREATI